MTRLPSAVLCLLLPAAPAIAGESTAKDPVSSAVETFPPAENRDHFQVSAGWMWRQVGDVRFVSGSRSGSLALPSLFGGSRISDPPIGSAGAYGDRRYADGYVGVDGGTASDGATSLWGYDNAGQVGGGAVSYHAQGSRREAGGGHRNGPDGSWDGDDGGNAPVVQLDWWRELTPRFSVGAQLQWSFLQLDGDHRSSDFTAWRESRSFTRSFTDRYDLHGITAPAAPYAGAGLGYGPLLDNLPASRDFSERSAGGDRAVYFNKVRQSFDLRVNTLSLGPTAAFRNDRFALQASAGFALNIADWDAEQRETLYLSRNGGPAKTVRQWRDHEGGTDLLPGFYLQGGASCRVTPRLSLTGFGRYDWSERLEAGVGPSSFSVDLSGWSVGAMVGLSF